MLQSIFSASCPVSRNRRMPHPRASSEKPHDRRDLHETYWLDIPARVVFKLCVLASRCQHGSAPPYLADYFIPVGAIEGRSNLRSAATGQLCVPRTKTVTHQDCDNWLTGIRCSPTAWNNLSVDLRDPNLTLSCFREKLKTHLFKVSSTL